MSNARPPTIWTLPLHYSSKTFKQNWKWRAHLVKRFLVSRLLVCPLIVYTSVENWKLYLLSTSGFKIRFLTLPHPTLACQFFMGTSLLWVLIKCHWLGLRVSNQVYRREAILCLDAWKNKAALKGWREMHSDHILEFQTGKHSLKIEQNIWNQDCPRKLG